MSETLLQPTPEQITENNNSAPPTPPAPTDPAKRKKKFCFAFIPAVFLYLFSGGLAIYYFFAMYTNYISRFTPDVILSDQFAFNIISTAISYLATPAVLFFFILFTLIRKPKILLPLTFGASILAANFVSVTAGIISAATGGATFVITNILNPSLFTDVVICVVCILFAVESPSLKKFLTKTKYIWATALSVLHLSGIALAVNNRAFSLLFETNRLGIMSSYLISFIISDIFMTYIPIFLESVIIFLLIIWLANPYKKPRAPRPVRQPVQPAPIFVPVQPAPTVADELGKYKSLLDTGAITQEEYDKLKASIINPQ